MPARPPSHPARGRPKDPAKRAAILTAATQLFLRDGYEGASMDQIAASAGVSKLTLYSHFGDKQALFAQAVRAYSERGVPDALFEPTDAMPLRAHLRQLGLAVHGMAMQPDALAGYRMMCNRGLAEAEVGEVFWQAGPQRIIRAFERLIAHHVALGALEVAEVGRAAGHLVTLLRGEAHARAVLGLGAVPPDAATMQAHVDAVVELFLRAYGRG